MPIDPAKWTASCQAYEETWETLDTCLYDLCEKKPEHADYPDVLAKATIIGRSYQTGIERHIGVPHTKPRVPGAAIVHLSRLLSSGGTKIDRLIAQIPDDQTLTNDDARTIVAAHGDLLNLLDARKTPRSFVSKYLHFHRPSVPIYDGYAQKILYRHFPWRPEYELFERPQASDERYYWHVLRFMELYRQVKSIDPSATVKQTDYFLLNYLRST